MKEILSKAFRKLYPNMDYPSRAKKVSLELYKRTGKVERDVTHFRMPDTYNVRCLNGSAHANRTSDFNFVTCPLCLDENTYKEHWLIKKYGI